MLQVVHRVSLQEWDAGDHSAGDPADQPLQRGAAAQVPGSAGLVTVPLHGPTPSGTQEYCKVACKSNFYVEHYNVQYIHIQYS